MRTSRPVWCADGGLPARTGRSLRQIERASRSYGSKTVRRVRRRGRRCRCDELLEHRAFVGVVDARDGEQGDDDADEPPRPPGRLLAGEPRLPQEGGAQRLDDFRRVGDLCGEAGVAELEPGGQRRVRAHQPDRGQHRVHDHVLRVADPGHLLRDQRADAPGLAVDERQLQRLPAVEVAVQRGAGTSGRPGNLGHSDGGDAVLDVQLGRDVEDSLGGEAGAFVAHPVGGHAPPTRNGTLVGRRT